MKQSILQFISGGQIFDYKTKMMIQVSNRIFSWAIFGFIVLFSVIMVFYAWTELKLVGLNQISHILVKAHYEDQVLWTNLNGSKITAQLYQNSPMIQSTVRLAKESLITKSKVSLFLAEPSIY